MVLVLGLGAARVVLGNREPLGRAPARTSWRTARLRWSATRPICCAPRKPGRRLDRPVPRAGLVRRQPGLETTWGQTRGHSAVTTRMR